MSRFEDVQLVATSRKIYDRELEGIQNPFIESLKKIVKDLDEQATAVIAGAQLEAFQDNEPLLLTGDAERDVYAFADDPLEQNLGIFEAGNNEDILPLYSIEDLF